MEGKPEKKPNDSFYYWLALRIASDFVITIAAPAIIATLIGTKLDEKWGSEPYAIIILLIIAFGLTAMIIVRKAKYYGKLYDEGPRN